MADNMDIGYSPTLDQCKQIKGLLAKQRAEINKIIMAIDNRMSKSSLSNKWNKRIHKEFYDRKNNCLQLLEALDVFESRVNNEIAILLKDIT